jgi:hypothetical protein
VFAKPSTIAFAENNFKLLESGGTEAFDEDPIERVVGGRSPRPRLLSLCGVDVTGVILSGLDLSACLFHGTHKLDRMRIEGSPFATTPSGWRFGRVGDQGPPAWRWTRRWALAEEHRWRASRYHLVAACGRPHPKRAGWYPPTVQSPEWLAQRTEQPLHPLPPGRVASFYRALRKAREDSKNEPGAADLYYGEMEMRRLEPATPWSEPFILNLYWLASGYGLRGLGALAWLAASSAPRGSRLRPRRPAISHGSPALCDRALLGSGQATLCPAGARLGVGRLDPSATL